jgi:hypothetical protein
VRLLIFDKTIKLFPPRILGCGGSIHCAKLLLLMVVVNIACQPLHGSFIMPSYVVMDMLPPTRGIGCCCCRPDEAMAKQILPSPHEECIPSSCGCFRALSRETAVHGDDGDAPNNQGTTTFWFMRPDCDRTKDGRSLSERTKEAPSRTCSQSIICLSFGAIDRRWLFK